MPESPADTIALVSYPLSTDYRRKLEATLGASPETLSLAELRQLSPLAMLRKLRALRAKRLVVPLEDENSLALAPILELLAAVAGAERKELIAPDLSVRPLGRLGALTGLARFAAACVAGQLVLVKTRRAVDGLLREPLQAIGALGDGPVYYFKTNLWFGVKAGGSVGHIAGVVNALVRRGFAVDFVSGEPPTMVDPATRFHAVTPPRAYGVPFETNLYRFNWGFIEQVRAMALPKPRFIYQRLSIANVAGPILARALRVPLVIEYNGSEVWVAKNWGRPLVYHDLASKAEAVCLKHAHVVVTVSDVLRDELVAERGVAAEKVVSYPNCIDPEVFDPARFSAEDSAALRRELGIPADALVATFIGTFGKWHGVEVLAEAIRRRVDRDAGALARARLHFLLVGDGLLMPQVRELIGGDAYRPYVTLTGLVPQDQAPRYLAASDILLSPHVANADGSRFFGSPTKLFEYMAMAKGIVASDLEQIGEILANSVRHGGLPTEAPADDDDRLAVLVPPGDPEALMDAVAWLAAAPAWRAHLGANVRRTALARYTWDHHVAAILAGLDRCLGRTG